VVLALAPLAMTACGVEHGGGRPCPGSCPVATATAAVGVVTTPPMVVNGVEAVLTGPVSGTMTCTPNPPVFAVSCAWPPAVAVVPGTYSLQVSAPGYETTTIQAEVTGRPPGLCGCWLASIKPSTVLISPTDGGVDASQDVTPDQNLDASQEAAPAPIGTPCTSDNACASGFCEKPDGMCDAVGGTCQDNSAGAVCAINMPECGCDGQTYDSGCFRRRARVSMAHDGPC